MVTKLKATYETSGCIYFYFVLKVPKKWVNVINDIKDKIETKLY